MANHNPTDIEEVWKSVPILRYKALYEVSNLGRVRRSARGPRTRIGHVLKPHTSRKTGYPKVALSCPPKGRGRRIVTTPNVHVLVALAFLGPRPKGSCVDHKDGDKTNCCLNNLEYVTDLENHRRALALGLVRDRKGSQLSWAKLKEEDIPAIRQALHDGELQRSIAERYGVDRTAIGCIKRNKSWRHIT